MDFSKCPICKENLNVALDGHLWCLRCGKDLDSLEAAAGERFESGVADAVDDIDASEVAYAEPLDSGGDILPAWGQMGAWLVMFVVGGSVMAVGMAIASQDKTPEMAPEQAAKPEEASEPPAAEPPRQADPEPRKADPEPRQADPEPRKRPIVGEAVPLKPPARRKPNPPADIPGRNQEHAIVFDMLNGLPDKGESLMRVMDTMQPDEQDRVIALIDEIFTHGRNEKMMAELRTMVGDTSLTRRMDDVFPPARGERRQVAGKPVVVDEMQAKRDAAAARRVVREAEKKQRLQMAARLSVQKRYRASARIRGRRAENNVRIQQAMANGVRRSVGN